jgi:hypothetical protein
MLYENDVIESVCVELRRRGYSIEQKLTTIQRGDDIIAVSRDARMHRLLVEAKGAMSSHGASKRHGKPFDSAQVRVHVAEAFYKAAEVLSRSSLDEHVSAAIAFPDDHLHRACTERIRKVLDKLGIIVFWVRDDRSVQIDAPFDL